MADVDPLAAIELQRLPAQVIVADGRDEDDLGARTPGRDGLVGPLAAGRGRERAAQDRLPGAGSRGTRTVMSVLLDPKTTTRGMGFVSVFSFQCPVRRRSGPCSRLTSLTDRSQR